MTAQHLKINIIVPRNVRMEFDNGFNNVCNNMPRILFLYLGTFMHEFVYMIY